MFYPIIGVIPINNLHFIYSCIFNIHFHDSSVYVQDEYLTRFLSWLL